MAEIIVRYHPRTIEKITATVLHSEKYVAEDKVILLKMLEQMRRQDWLLYMVDIYQEAQYDFEIPNYPRFKQFIKDEVYSELIEQFIEMNREYEEVPYGDIPKWFYGMTINIELLTVLDKRLNELDVKIMYTFYSLVNPEAKFDDFNILFKMVLETESITLSCLMRCIRFFIHIHSLRY